MRMAAKRDYYEVLGVPRDADAKAVRAAYRRLAREYHPDVSAEADAHERFQEIGEAYAVLSDNEKRARYDQFGHGGVEGPGIDFGGFPDIFEMFRAVVGGFGYEQEPTPRGNDLLEELDISLEEVVTGVEREVAVSRYVACEECTGEGAEPGTKRQRCPTCRGLGRVRYQQRSMFLTFSQEAECPDCGGTGIHIPTPCKKCRGTGRRRKTEKVTVKVPPGVDDGQRIRFAARGDAGPLGSQSGDLYVRVRVRPHELFVRRGADLVCEVPLDFAQMALGDAIEVPGIAGTHQVTIPPGTQHGETLTVRGGGLPRSQRAHHRGDLHILVRVNVPRRLSKKQRELLLQLSKASGLNVTPQPQGLADTIGEALRGKG
jgi:molecular chaperone DnaJ